MNNSNKNMPIGVFDSGLGGLTVVKQLQKHLPNENIVYFGDTGRVPYGTKSNHTIEKYTLQDCKFLLSRNVKMIIAACGTASSVAPNVWQNQGVPNLGVVTPAAKAALKSTQNGKIGVIATSATINTNAFGRVIAEANRAAQIFNKACPLFVPLAENGWTHADDQIAYLTAERYLAPLREHDIDTLILGCTHFPLLVDVIGKVMGDGVTLIDAGVSTAVECERLLREHDLLKKDMDTSHEYYVSDRPQDFSSIAKLCLGRDIASDVCVVDIESF